MSEELTLAVREAFVVDWIQGEIHLKGTGLLRVGLTRLSIRRHAFHSICNALDGARYPMAHYLNNILQTVQEVLATILQVLLRLLVHVNLLCGCIVLLPRSIARTHDN